MSIEYEARILFVVGVTVVLAAELVIGIVFRKTEICKSLVGHTLCLLLAFACVFYMVNAPKAPDGVPYNGSGLLAIVGLLWFAAEYILIRALFSKNK